MKLPRRFIALTAVLLTAACSQPSYLSVDHVAEASLDGDSIQGGFAAGASGRLYGTVHGDHACFWLGDPKTPDNRGLITWPEGYRALDSPLRVVADDGQVFRTVGEEVSLTGGATKRSGTCGSHDYDQVWRVTG